MRTKKLWTGFLVASLLASSAWAADLPKRFTLSQYVPSDCWFFVHGVHNPERAWVDAQWERVGDAFAKSGVLDEIKMLVMSKVPPDNKDQVDQLYGAISNLVTSVKWSELFGNEVVFAERMNAHNIQKVGNGVTILPDYVLLTRPAEGEPAAHAASLAGILQWLAGLGGLPVQQADENGTKTWSLTIDEAGFSVHIIQHGPVVGMVTGERTLKQVTGMMAGSGDTQSIIDTPRFKQALAGLPAPEDAVTFFDAAGLVGDLRSLFDAIIKSETGDAEEPGPEVAKVKRILNSIMELVDVFDYTITTVEFDRRRELSHTLARIREGKQDAPLVKVFIDRKPFAQFDRFIPEEATSFSVNGFFDVEGLYNLVLGFVEKNIPEGAEAVAQWKMLLASTGFDPQTELFSWWSGEMISVTLPPAVPTPMSAADSVVFIRVKDAELAQKKVNAGIDFVNALLTQEGKPLMIMPAQVSKEGFRSVTHPMVMMFGLKLVVGVYDEWLVIGSSEPAVNKCFAVAAGDAPSISKNARFQEEGLQPAGKPVHSLSFTDQSNFGQDLAMAIQMGGFVGNMVMANIPEDDPDARDAKGVMQAIFNILLKLGPVAQQIDFYSSSSTLSTVDNLNIRTEMVTAYKPPKKEKPKTEAGAQP